MTDLQQPLTLEQRVIILENKVEELNNKLMVLQSDFEYETKTDQYPSRIEDL